MLPVKPDIKWRLAAQIGVILNLTAGPITKAAPELSGQLPPWDFASLSDIHRRFAECGFRLYALEGDDVDMSRIKLGLPGRDEDIAKYQTMLRNMGKLDIPVLCYNFMAGVGWYRTRVDMPERGGAFTSGFDTREKSRRGCSPEDHGRNICGRTTSISSRRFYRSRRRQGCGWGCIPTILRSRLCSVTAAY